MDLELMFNSFPKLLSATLVTVKLLSASLFFGLFIGLLFAILRLNKNIFINKFAYGYSYVFRGTPLLVQIFIIYFGLAQIEFLRTSFLWVILKEPYWCAIIAFTLNTGAYTSEILRSAFQTIKPGIIEAGKSLGITNKIIFYKIQIPIAIRQSLPAYGNEIILMMKGTSLASTVTLMDLTGVAKYIISTTFKPIEVFIVAGGIYLFMTFIIHNVIKYLEKERRKSRIGARSIDYIVEKESTTTQTDDFADLVPDLANVAHRRNRRLKASQVDPENEEAVVEVMELAEDEEVNWEEE